MTSYDQFSYPRTYSRIGSRDWYWEFNINQSTKILKLSKILYANYLSYHMGHMHEFTTTYSEWFWNAIFLENADFFKTADLKFKSYNPLILIFSETIKYLFFLSFLQNSIFLWFIISTLDCEWMCFWPGLVILFYFRKSMGILDFFSVFSLRKSLLAIFSLKNVSKTKSTFSLTHK